MFEVLLLIFFGEILWIRFLIREISTRNFRNKTKKNEAINDCFPQTNLEISMPSVKIPKEEI